MPMASSIERATEPERVLRRVEVSALILALAGLAFFATRSLVEAVFLTLGAGISIVSFRGLRALVGRLGAPGKGKPDDRSRRRIWLRFSLLILIPLTTLWLDSARTLALLVGFSVIPLALVSEGFYQIYVGLTVGKTHGS